MAESIVEAGGEESEEEEKSMAAAATVAVVKSRKEKRKERKKVKRKQIRKEIAEKEREEEEAKLNDPEEQKRLKEIEEEEIKRMEKARKEFEERERKFLEENERKRKLLEEEEEEENRKVLEAEKEDNKFQVEKENEYNDDDEWEYVEEGPAEIIWQGNEIIVRKKKVKVPKKKSADQQSTNEDDRPTSNPLPPQCEAFAEYQNASMLSAEQLLENVAQQVPNFGTELDKAHCPFHLKTGACRFGQRCSRVHFYPDKANTLLMKNMYHGPGLACEQDEGLEYTDEEVERCYEEFYEDVHTEFLKYGEIVNFKVCKNSSFHLRGNVYVHYKSLDSTVLAYHSINGRYFAGKQVNCEFVNVTRWKVAICGEYMKSRLKICSRGTACNFIHCFRNPGGDYEWADWDKPPPRYWIKKMTALFGYSSESPYEKHMEQEKFEQLKMSSKTISADTERHCQSRSRSRDINHLFHCSDKISNDEDDQEGSHRHGHTDDDRKWRRIHNEKSYERDYRHSEHGSQDSVSDGGWSDKDSEIDRDKKRHHGHVTKRSQHHGKVTGSRGKSKDRNYEAGSDEWSDGGRKGQKMHARAEGSRHRIKRISPDDYIDWKNELNGANERQSDREKNLSHMGRSSRHQTKVRSTDDLRDGKESYREKDRHRHDRPERKRSRHHSSASEYLDDHQDYRYRTCDADPIDDWLDKNKERHQSHKKRRSRQSEELSDDEGITAKRLKEKSYNEETEIGKSDLKRKPIGLHLSRRSHASRKTIERNPSVESLNPSGNHEFNYVDHDSRYRSIEETNDQDRWKPESPD